MERPTIKGWDHFQSNNSKSLAFFVGGTKFLDAKSLLSPNKNRFPGRDGLTEKATLPETNKSHLKMDAFLIPVSFWVRRPIFRCVVWLLVSGREKKETNFSLQTHFFQWHFGVHHKDLVKHGKINPKD